MPVPDRRVLPDHAESRPRKANEIRAKQIQATAMVYISKFCLRRFLTNFLLSAAPMATPYETISDEEEEDDDEFLDAYEDAFQEFARPEYVCSHFCSGNLYC